MKMRLAKKLVKEMLSWKRGDEVRHKSLTLRKSFPLHLKAIKRGYKWA